MLEFDLLQTAQAYMIRSRNVEDTWEDTTSTHCYHCYSSWMIRCNNVAGMCKHTAITSYTTSGITSYIGSYTTSGTAQLGGTKWDTWHNMGGTRWDAC
jgi:hypothetical protein